ncbi:glutathione-dependent disulfide-bond oxidoreductase [Erythrobacter sp. LQ02-29]|uniref:glutathione-dependent disulfide-bond oxidoreductase n=1 Tax=Erythrobacter sp. LQ02-29 TaxID=2920384 RepID=UPI001F4DF4C3|nr:glutathione-dependent disulfide-bond oxidoreductase [Erythrobacter sp. LQ02-29]MCP9222018.1 glutathione-dependent disulfide-bond oxidoreductase [Erythrobacter sp. LQ02-29]
MADHEPADNLPAGYEPPKVWNAETESGGQFAGINRPTAGARYDRDLPVGDHPFQLYSLATPNGQKAAIMFEELLAAGHAEAEYDAWLINIMDGDQFSSGFVDVNPNSKIPALLDRSGSEPVRVFESGSILLHLAEKFGAFLPASGPKRTETLNWLMWQMGAGPFLGGGFGHFYAYAPIKIEYAIDRFAMEVKRQLDLLDSVLADRRFIAGEDFSIADMAIYPWYGGVMKSAYDAQEFLQVEQYANLQRYAEEVGNRPAVRRGEMVNNIRGPAERQLHERHDARDFDLNTQDKVEARGGERVVP